MNITIVGAGNIGTQFAVHCAEAGHVVTLFGSKPERVNKQLAIVDENDVCIHTGEIAGATSDPETAFANAELIFITLPAYCMQDIAKTMLPYAKENMYIGIIPGTGGGECAFHECLAKGAVVFGLQRVPSVARLVEYGRVVRATGYRDELFLASLPASQGEHLAKLVSRIFHMPCGVMHDYLNLTLTPSNPILHTTRLRKLFENYEEGMIYDRIPLFYEEWNDETSRLLFLCDDEVQNLCRVLSEFDLSFVKSLKVHYESDTPEALTRKIRSIKGFKGLPSPQIAVENGFIPDWNSRYFTADFPYGLSILVQIADLFGCEATNMKETLRWYHEHVAVQKEFCFADYGITDKAAFLDFYRN